MTALASGSSVSLSLGDNGYVNVATNGGLGSATVTPSGGTAQRVVFGPSPYRQKLGPYTEGSVVVLDNNTCPSFDYDEFDPASGGGSGSFLGSGNQAAMLAVTGSSVVAGSFFTRTDTTPSTTWQLDALPASTFANWREVGASGPGAQTFYFSAAGTYIIANGPATAYGIFLTSSVVGTVRIYDNTAASGPDVLGSTATAVAANVSIPIGVAPTYGAANSGLCLVVTGTNVGYVTFGE